MTAVEQRATSGTHEEYLMSSTQKSWWLASIKCNEALMTQMLSETPSLAHWQNYIDGNSALHYAAKAGNTSLIRLLIGNHHVDANVRNAAGQTPLHWASRAAQKDAIFLLTAMYGADPALSDYYGRIPEAYLPDTKAGVDLKKTFKTTRAILLSGKNKELFSLLDTMAKRRSRSNSPAPRLPDGVFGGNSHTPIPSQFPWKAGGTGGAQATVGTAKHFSPAKKPLMFSMSAHVEEIPKAQAARRSRIASSSAVPETSAQTDLFSEITNGVKQRRERAQIKYNPLTAASLPTDAPLKPLVKSKLADKKALLADKLVLKAPAN